MSSRAFSHTTNEGEEATLFDEPMQAPPEAEGVELVVVEELPSPPFSLVSILQSPSVIAAFLLALVIISGVIVWCLR